MHCELMQAVDVGSNIRESLPYFTTKIQAGFPSPADDFMDNRLNINDFIIKNPISTYYVKVSGDSMIGAGIFSGDILVVEFKIASLRSSPN